MANTNPPANDPTRVIWTREQQNQLDELERNRAAAMLWNRPPVDELLYSSGLFSERDRLFDSMVQWMVDNAAQVRTVLRPFDLEAQSTRSTR